ncbi:MAG: hypothetical protein ACI8PZ_005312 [Myxococcota bacterium]|jgi:hypothetical protein
MRATIPMVCLLVVGCVQFAGDRGKLGFASNLAVDGVREWTPGSGVADGTHARFVAVDRLDVEGEQTPEVTGGARGVQVVRAVGPKLTVTGAGERGVLRFDGEVADKFGVAFRPVEQALLVDRWLAYAGAEDAAFPDRFGALGPLPVTVSLRDSRGRSLGYDPTDVAITGADAVTWTDSDGLVLHPGDALRGLTLEVGAEAHAGPELVKVDADDVVEITLDTHTVTTDEGEAVWLTRVVGWTEDALPVFGLKPEWAGEDERVDGWAVHAAPGGVRADWEGLSVGEVRGSAGF